MSFEMANISVNILSLKFVREFRSSDRCRDMWNYYVEKQQSEGWEFSYRVIMHWTSNFSVAIYWILLGKYTSVSSNIVVSSNTFM